MCRRADCTKTSVKKAVSVQSPIHNLFRMITPENVAEVLDSLPEQFRSQMIVDARVIPDPQKMRTFCIECVILRTDADREAYEARKEHEAQQYRNGLQAVKDYAIANELFF